MGRRQQAEGTPSPGPQTWDRRAVLAGGGRAAGGRRGGEGRPSGQRARPRRGSWGAGAAVPAQAPCPTRPVPPPHRCTHPAQVTISAGTLPPTRPPRPPAAPTPPPSTWQVWGSPGTPGVGPGVPLLAQLTSPSPQTAACTPRPSSGALQARRALGPCWGVARRLCPSHQAAPWALGLAVCTSTSAW